jgi:exosortase/archaeosortase family protein
MTADALPGRPAAAPHRHRRQGSGVGGGRRRAREPAAQSSASTLGRLVIAVILLAAAVPVLSESLAIRDFEAWMASRVIALGASVPTGHYAGGLAMAWFLLNPHERVGLVITPECTVAFLIIPFLLATALLVRHRVAPLSRQLTALGVALVLLAMLNQIRLLVIVWIVQAMGYGAAVFTGVIP